MEQSTSKTQEAVRRAVAAAHTVVVKVGSSSLTQPSGHLDVDKLTALVGAIAQVHMLGGNIVLVSSGAIAAGFGPLGFSSRPTDVATQQAAASVGQGLLMAQYEAAFGRYGIRVGAATDHRGRHDAAAPIPQRAPHDGHDARAGRRADRQRERRARQQRNPFWRQRPPLRAHREHGARRRTRAADRRRRAVHGAAERARVAPRAVRAERDPAD